MASEAEQITNGGDTTAAQTEDEKDSSCAETEILPESAVSVPD